MQNLTLTFDNGPTSGVTERVLDELASRDLLATFFVIGSKAATPAGSDLINEMVGRGHWVGNHTWSHGEPLGLVTDSAATVREIADTQALLGDRAEPRRLFRPTGHGSIGPHLLSQAAYEHLRAGEYTMALWSLFVRDSRQPEGWVTRALTRLPEKDWHVLVLHDLPTGAMDALPRFLDAVAERGIHVVQDFPSEATPLVGGVEVSGFEDLYVTGRRESEVDEHGTH